MGSPGRTLVGGRSGLGAARAPAARGLLPLAPGRGTRRRRRAARRGERAAQEAHAVAARIGAQPLLHELELLAERARLDLDAPEAGPHHAKQGLEEPLGLTPREAEVLTLVARGYTNREIAATLVISVKTAGVHVSHILRKLDAPNRVEAAAIAHRLLPPHGGRRELES